MKKILLLICISTSAFAYQCEDYIEDKNKFETLEFIAKNTLGYESAKSFCQKDKFLDLELSFMPNYFKYQEEDDDHYRLLVHYSYSSCTYIYNMTQKFVTYKKCYSTW